ncbi:MAG TPA: OPT/YSL family transporter, partial [Verrucomicrobiae bacterium]|nr:OPT/YSL family transporter [Verrucomicrobiae bacterium]
KLVLWIGFWAAGIILVGSQLLHQPVKFLVVAVALSFVFVMVNGISQGISDSNPISSAFVVTVFILAQLGLRDPGVGLICAAILLIATSEGGDMQQDRSTGWRLGTNRIVQFRYQVIGIAVGAVLAIVLAKLFMNAYPILKVDQFAHQGVEGTQKWQSAMTFKFVGALRGITKAQPHIMKALQLGILIGLFIEIARRLIKKLPGYKSFSTASVFGRVTDFLLDAVILPNPYASSLGGFLELYAIYWWTLGGVGSSIFDFFQNRRKSANASPEDLPEDMSTMSLVGGGLIAGDALAALSFGLYGLLKVLL